MSTTPTSPGDELDDETDVVTARPPRKSARQDIGEWVGIRWIERNRMTLHDRAAYDTVKL